MSGWGGGGLGSRAGAGSEVARAWARGMSKGRALKSSGWEEKVKLTGGDAVREAKKRSVSPTAVTQSKMSATGERSMCAVGGVRK